MIIDAHVHIPFREDLTEQELTFMKKKSIDVSTLAGEPSELLGTLDRVGIDRAIVFPLAMPSYSKTEAEIARLNERTAAFVSAAPERLIGFAVLNPHHEVRVSLQVLSYAIEDLKLKGVKLHPTLQSFYPNDRKLFEIYEHACENKIPILFHSGASLPSHADHFSRPIFIDEVAVRYPELRIILAHIGRPWYLEAAMLMRKHTNVYADISANVGRSGGAALLELVLLTVKVYSGAMDRILFGSDFPVYQPGEMLSLFGQASKGVLADVLKLPKLTETEIKGILGENAKRLLLL